MQVIVIAHLLSTLTVPDSSRILHLILKGNWYKNSTKFKHSTKQIVEQNKKFIPKFDDYLKYLSSPINFYEKNFQR